MKLTFLWIYTKSKSLIRAPNTEHNQMCHLKFPWSFRKVHRRPSWLNFILSKYIPLKPLLHFELAEVNAVVLCVTFKLIDAEHYLQKLPCSSPVGAGCFRERECTSCQHSPGALRCCFRSLWKACCKYALSDYLATNFIIRYRKKSLQTWMTYNQFCSCFLQSPVLI